MNTGMKCFLVAVLPPCITSLLRWFRGMLSKPLSAEHVEEEWAFNSEGWGEEDDTIGGWERADAIAGVMEKNWTPFVESIQAPNSLLRSNEAVADSGEDIGFHNTVMTFGYVVSRTLCKSSEISILDWGGGVGHYFLIGKSLFPESKMAYTCVDTPVMCQLGKHRLPSVRFLPNLDNIADERYDLVMASSSLHYVQDWREVFRGLAKMSCHYVYITRTPFVKKHPSFVVVQRPYQYGYETEYKGWCINTSEFLRIAKDLGLILEREFLVAECIDFSGIPEKAEYRGFLFSVNRDCNE